MRRDEPDRDPPSGSPSGRVPGAPGAIGRVGERGRRRDRGQSTVELALVLPVVVALALALIQIGLVVRDQVRVTHAAREGARAAAVSADPGAAPRAVEANAGLAGDRLDIVTSSRGGVGSHVTVTVRFVAVTDLPLIGPLVPDLTLTGEATMRVEQ